MPVTCDDLTISLNQLLNSLRAQTGSFTGLRVRIVTAAAGDITSPLACGAPNVSNDDVMRLSIGLSASGEPALILIAES